MSNVETSVPYSIHTGGQGHPTLHVSYTNDYDFIWSDKGSHASADCSVWRPVLVPGQGYFIIGDHAQGNYHAAAGTALVVKPVNDDPDRPLLMPPTDWVEVWNNKNSRGGADGSVWAPLPPAEYHALGHVATAGYEKPDIATFRCVREDLLEPTKVGKTIWADHKSHAGKIVRSSRSS